MQAPTTSPGTSFSTAGPNVTKSKEQIMIQSSGAMIAVIVLGVIVILAILLLILKTYNRHTQVSRMLGTSGGSKSRQKMSNNTTATASPSGLLPPPLSSGTPMRTLTISSVSAGVHRRAGSASENGGFVFGGFPRAELSDTQHNDLERHSNASGSTAVTIHDVLSLGNT